MMRMSSINNGLRKIDGGFGNSVGGGGGRERAEEEKKEWEVRPGGMLVQTRSEAVECKAPTPIIRVRVKYGSIYHEIRISSQATFGELKRMLSGPTGLHHLDQKLFYKDKERDSNTFLDHAGVKDKSKIVLVEDDVSKEKRYIEMRKISKMEKSAKSISDISLEVDRLARKVSALESVVSKGGKVVDKDVSDLIELLMNQLLKLDAISADGDVRLKRKMQVMRVQKCVEILDALKKKNSIPATTSNEKDNLLHAPTPQTQRQQQQTQQQEPKYSNERMFSPTTQTLQYSNGGVLPAALHQHRHSFGHSLSDSPKQNEAQPSRHSASGAAVVITTQWETFDSAPGAHAQTSTTTRTTHSPQPSFTWDLL